MLLLAAIGHIVSPQALAIGWDNVAMPGPNTQCNVLIAPKSQCLHFLRKINLQKAYIKLTLQVTGESILALLEKLNISASVEKLLSIVYCVFLWLELCLLQIWLAFHLCFKHLPNTAGHKVSQSYRKNQLKTESCGSLYCLKLFENIFLQLYWVIFMCKENSDLLHHHYIKILLLAMHSHHIENK